MSSARGAPRRRRPFAWTLAGLGAAALASVPVAAGARITRAQADTAHGAGVSSPAPLSSAPAAPRTQERALYRPVGCLRRGAPIAYSSGPPRHVVALTFDDGPSPYTAAFVKMLAAEHVPATFFMIGEQVTGAYRSTLHQELRDGDALGDHTYTHPDLLLSGDVYGQLQRTLLTIRRLSGYTPCVFRPPYGDYDQAVIATAKSLGLATILWDVDPSDYTLPGVGAIEQRVLAQVRPGSIILSHDGGGPRGQTLAAYPYIIRMLRKRGYRFETVPQLLGFKTEYVPCVRSCEGEGVSAPLPAGSIIVKVPPPRSSSAPRARDRN